MPRSVAVRKKAPMPLLQRTRSSRAALSQSGPHAQQNIILKLSVRRRRRALPARRVLDRPCVRRCPNALPSRDAREAIRVHRPFLLRLREPLAGGAVANLTTTPDTEGIGGRRRGVGRAVLVRVHCEGERTFGKRGCIIHNMHAIQEKRWDSQRGFQDALRRASVRRWRPRRRSKITTRATPTMTKPIESPTSSARDIP